MLSTCTTPYSNPTTTRQILHLLHLTTKPPHSLNLTQQTHTQISLHQNPIITTHLINPYSHSLNPLHSQTLLNSLQPTKKIFIYNTLLTTYLNNNLYHQCFHIYNTIAQNLDCPPPDEFTFSSLAKVSGVIGELCVGKWVHGKCLRLGFVADTVLANSLMAMYCKCGGREEARRVFDEMGCRSVASWNVMMGGCFDGFDGVGVCEFVKCMLSDGFRPNEFTLSSLFPYVRFDHGRELHCYVVRSGMDVDAESGVRLECCLIDMYSRHGNVRVARFVFDKMRFRNVYVWTSMMSGYLQNEEPEETVRLFCNMQRTSEVELNEVSLLTLLQACSVIAGLVGVELVHGFSVKKGFVNHTLLCNSLIDLYSKNGLLKSARKVFDHDCRLKDAISWGCMISGCGLHGKGNEAVALYDEMIKSGIQPDAITMVGVLSACSKSGLIQKGLDAYSKAMSVSGFEPTVEICSCVVDLLGRSGQYNEALRFIKAMPFEPGPSVWGALVSASVVHANFETRVLGYKSLIEIEPENPSNYVSLSNLYATSRKWEYVADVRRMMKERNLRKLPGCSWITVNNKTHSFLVADKAHPASDKIYESLNELILVMKRP